VRDATFIVYCSGQFVHIVRDWSFCGLAII